MKVFNKHTYSFTEFENYKFRVRCEFNDSDNVHIAHSTDVYTDEPDKNAISGFLNALTSNKITEFKCINFTTKEQDIAVSKFIEETMKDWNGI